MELGTGLGPGRQHVNVFKIKAKTAELSMPQCQYNNPPSVVFIKLNYINVRTAGGDEQPPPTPPPNHPLLLCRLNGPTNKTDKTSEIRKLVSCARRERGGVELALWLAAWLRWCPTVFRLSRQRLVKHQCVCPFDSVRSVPRPPPRVLVSLTSRQRRNHELST